MGFAIDRIMPADHHVLIVQIKIVIINSRLQIIIYMVLLLPAEQHPGVSIVQFHGEAAGSVAVALNVI